MAKQPSKDYAARAREMVKASEGNQPPTRSTPQRGQTRELIEALLFAAIAALFLKTFIVEAYRIPTGSMETTLKVGDFLLVNKFLYFLRTPTSIPLSLIPGMNMSDVRLPHFSMNGMRNPKKGDIVVFEYPGDRDEVHHDELTNYIKRCVGTPGDTIIVRQKMLSVNGQEFMHPPHMQFRLTISVNDTSAFHSLTEGVAFVSAEDYFQNPAKYHLYADPPHMPDPSIFPNGAPWNHDNYGPLRVPKKDDVVALNASTFNLWNILIQREGHTCDLRNGTVLVDGKPATTYIVQRNYYFMMGDNRDDSADSRFWGFVPDDNIVGQAMIVYWSWDPSISVANFGKLIASIRWSRLFHLIY